MAEFTLVIVLLVMLFLSLIQVCLWAYTRTLLTAAAAETARYAGLADISDFDVTKQVREALGDGITGSTRDSLVCTRSSDGVLVQVRCSLTSPGLVGLLDGVLPAVTVTGHAAVEGTP